MKLRLMVPAAIALLMCGFVPAAMAQPTTVLEIDFTNVALPLSPWLTALIAVVVGACGIYAQRRMRGRARVAAWMVLGIAATSVASMVLNVRALGDAQAIVVTSISLGSSPATAPVSGGGAGYIATNTSSGPITLTAVQLDNNPGGVYVINNPETTCVVGLLLASGASCLISVSATT